MKAYCLLERRMDWAPALISIYKTEKAAIIAMDEYCKADTEIGWDRSTYFIEEWEVL